MADTMCGADAPPFLSYSQDSISSTSSSTFSCDSPPSEFSYGPASPLFCGSPGRAPLVLDFSCISNLFPLDPIAHNDEELQYKIPEQQDYFYFDAPVQPLPSPDPIAPKTEESQDCCNIDVVPKILPATAQPVPSSDPPVVKRPRGRPRKHPIAQPVADSKPPKGRSKTGCVTCRRRKKKCDEAKPACFACRKNNVHCEGYPPKGYWKGGRQTPTDDKRRASVASESMPALIAGLETDIDHEFLEHLRTNVSHVLSLSTDARPNPFTKILLPMATHHVGLMHSLLFLASSHLLLVKSESRKEYFDRRNFHEDNAISTIRADEKLCRHAAGDKTVVIDDALIAQIVILGLTSAVAGDTRVVHNWHMNEARRLLATHESANKRFQSFMFELITFHDMATLVTTTNEPRNLVMKQASIPDKPEAANLPGISDGLYIIFAKIRGLRNMVAAKRLQDDYDWNDDEVTADLIEIEQSLRDLMCPDDDMSRLYHSCAWIFLYRSINPSQSHEILTQAIQRAFVHLDQLPSTSNLLLMPLFLLGCAAFDSKERLVIDDRFKQLKAHTRLGNIRLAQDAVHALWDEMDSKRDSWAWESLMESRVGHVLII